MEHFQSLYCRYDKGEMTKEEAFKIKAEKFGGSGAIIRHHNPAYEGIVNAAFIQEQVQPAEPQQPQVFQMYHHQFNNGRAQPIYYASDPDDTETERSIGEVIIPMTTFGKSEDIGSRKRTKSANNSLILDASKL